MPNRRHGDSFNSRKSQREDKLRERRQAKAERRAQRRAPEQSESLWPDAPEDAAGVARVLSHGGPL